MMLRIGLAARVAALASALAPVAGGAQESRALSVTYVCEGGRVLQAAFVTMGEMSTAVVAWQGELVPLRQVPSGSGVFYADFDEQRGLRWRGKGDEGVLASLAADHTATEQVLLDGCKAATAR